jgi:hypothetical protein
MANEQSTTETREIERRWIREALDFKYGFAKKEDLDKATREWPEGYDQVQRTNLQHTAETFRDLYERGKASVVVPEGKVIFRCDGCGKLETGSFTRGDAHKPHDWFSRGDEDGTQLACDRTCIVKIAKESGKTAAILPV